MSRIMEQQTPEQSAIRWTRYFFWSAFWLGFLAVAVAWIAIPLPEPPVVTEIDLEQEIDPGPLMVFMRFVDSFDMVSRQCANLRVQDDDGRSLDATQNALDAEKEGLRNIGLRGVTDPMFRESLGLTRRIMLTEWNSIADGIDRSVTQDGMPPSVESLSDFCLNAEMALKQMAFDLGLGEREVESAVRRYLERRIARSQQEIAKSGTETEADEPTEFSFQVDEAQVAHLTSVVKRILQSNPTTSR